MARVASEDEHSRGGRVTPRSPLAHPQRFRLPALVGVIGRSGGPCALAPMPIRAASSSSGYRQYRGFMFLIARPVGEVVATASSTHENAGNCSSGGAHAGGRASACDADLPGAQCVAVNLAARPPAFDLERVNHDTDTRAGSCVTGEAGASGAFEHLRSEARGDCSEDSKRDRRHAVFWVERGS